MNYGSSRRSREAPRWDSIRLPPGEYVARLDEHGEAGAVFELGGYVPVKLCAWPRVAQFVQKHGGEDLGEPLAWRVRVAAQ